MDRPAASASVGGYTAVMLNLVLLLALATLLWLLSVAITNASIVDPFWSIMFVVAGTASLLRVEAPGATHYVLLGAVWLWGLRLCLYLLWRSWGKPEDYRYQQFRQRYGAERYWWVSYFQVFVLQALLAWVIAAPLQLGLGVPTAGVARAPFAAGLMVFAVGFLCEAIADYQLARFRADSARRGQVLDSGLWRYSRHPNYFGEALVHFGFWLMAVAMGAPLWTVVAPLLKLTLLLKVSGVTLLEHSLKQNKPSYREYMEKTSAFVPLPPRTGT